MVPKRRFCSDPNGVCVLTCFDQKMQCEFESADVFVRMVDAIKDLCGEGNLDFGEDGMEMQVMDPAHVSMCSLLLRRSYFKAFKCDEPLSLGLNFKTLSMVLRGAKGGLKLKTSGDRLIVEMHKLDCSVSYTLNLMDIDSEHLGIPEIQHSTLCAMPTTLYTKLMKDLSDFSDTCTINISDKLYISAEGEIGYVKWESGEECKCNVRNPVQPLQFALRYLFLFSKCSVSDKLVIGMSEEMPMCLTFAIEQYGYMRFYLAPKITE